MRHRCKKLILEPAESLRLGAQVFFPLEYLLQLRGPGRHSKLEILIRVRQRGVCLKQVYEDADLRAQDWRNHRREDVIDGPKLIATHDLHLIGVARDENDRRVAAVLVIADQARRFQAIDIGHVDVEENHREFFAQHLLQRLGAGRGEDDVGIEIFEQRAIHQPLLGQIVNDENSCTSRQNGTPWVRARACAGHRYCRRPPVPYEPRRAAVSAARDSFLWRLS